MKRWNLKSFGAGVLVSALVLGLGIPALAATVKTAELHYSGIQIRLNGEPLALKDANGNTVEPFAIDGTTYLPVRAIGTGLGLSVNWDGETNTITLDKIPEADSLLDVNPVRGGYSHNGENDLPYAATDGSSYRKYITPRGSLEYSLKVTPYERFSGTLFVGASAHKHIDTSYQNRIQVYLDDTLVYTSEIFTAQTGHIDFDIPIAGGEKFVIMSQCRKTDTEEWRSSDNDNAYISIGNPSLWK